MELRLSAVVGAPSHALDVTHGRPGGTPRRSCRIAMRIARAAGLGAEETSALSYALLLKDGLLDDRARRSRPATALTIT